MNRTLDAARLHLVDRRIVSGSVLALALIVVLGVGFIAVVGPDVSPAGLLGGLYGGIAAAQAQTMGRLLPFVLAMGLTRRDFYRGTVLFVLAESVLLGALLWVGNGVEQLSGGWGGGWFLFGSAWLSAGDPVTQLLVFTAPFLITFPVMLLGGAIHARWGSWAVLVGAFAGGGLAVLFGVASAMGGVVDPALASGVLVPVVIGAVLVGAGWGVVRGSTP